MSDDPTRLCITVNGKEYIIRMSELTAIDAKDFRARVGVSLAQVMSNESADLDTVAGLVWLARRKRDPRVRFEDVARELTYDTEIDFGDGTEADDEPKVSDPEV